MLDFLRSQRFEDDALNNVGTDIRSGHYVMVKKFRERNDYGQRVAIEAPRHERHRTVGINATPEFRRSVWADPFTGMVMPGQQRGMRKLTPVGEAKVILIAAHNIPKKYRHYRLDWLKGYIAQGRGRAVSQEAKRAFIAKYNIPKGYHGHSLFWLRAYVKRRKTGRRFRTAHRQAKKVFVAVHRIPAWRRHHRLDLLKAYVARRKARVASRAANRDAKAAFIAKHDIPQRHRGRALSWLRDYVVRTESRAAYLREKAAFIARRRIPPSYHGHNLTWLKAYVARHQKVSDRIPVSEAERERRVARWQAFLQGLDQGVFDENNGNLMHQAQGLGLPVDEAEDLAQETWHKAVKTFSPYNGDAKIGVWLYRILVNAYWSRLRLKKTKASQDAHPSIEEHEPEVFQIQDERPSIEDDLQERQAARDARVQMEKILAILDPSDRLMIILALEAERSVDQGSKYAYIRRRLSEISGMEVPEGTMKSRLARAKEAFRNATQGMKGTT